MARTARTVGNMSVLFPEGVESIHDLPYTVADAIAKGLVFTSWDELPEDERPPRYMWLDPERLDKWFKEVKRKREARYGTDKKPPIEDPVDNAASKGLIVGDD